MSAAAAFAGSPCWRAVHGVVLLAPLARGLGVVRDRLGRLGQRPAGEVRPEPAGLDDHRRDAQRRDLLAERQRQRLDRGLDRRVVAGALGRDPRADRGEVDDRAGAPRAHAGQHRLDRADGAEDVGVEELADGVVLALLDGGAVAVAGVVDQHVDAAEPLLGGRTAAVTWASSVTSSGRASAVSGWASARSDRRGVAGGDDDVVAAREDGLGEGAAEAGRAAGDEPGGHGSPASLGEVKPTICRAGGDVGGVRRRQRPTAGDEEVGQARRGGRRRARPLRLLVAVGTTARTAGSLSRRSWSSCRRCRSGSPCRAG